MPDDPTNFQACDHGYTDWFIPTSARQHPMVLVHGSSARTYQTTFDGRPGFQTIFLRRKYPVYLVDLPWTGRAGKACQEYTWNPVSPGFSARFVFTNRIGLWPVNTPVTEKEFFPGSAFPRDSASLDQFFRNQYVEINDTMNVRIETDALAVLLEELYQEHGAGAVLHTHSSSAARGLLVARKSDKLAGQIIWEPSAAPVFPEGELPPPLRRADDSLFAAGTAIPLEEFLKLTTHPFLIIWGDDIPTEPDPANLGPLENRRLLVERYRLFAEAINNHGGDVSILHLPDVCLQGNTHYPMADKNIVKVAAVVGQWLKDAGLDKRRP
jgi:pimeloyl-ACP methyl ester carboxylesterase